MKKSGMARTGALLALSAGAGSAGAGVVIYENTFESGPLGAEWSSNALLERHGSFSRYNGRYSKTAVTLSLVAAPPPGGGASLFVGQIGSGSQVLIDGGHGGGGDDDGDGGGGDDGGGDGGGGAPYNLYTLEFDLYVIDSWDGEGKYGPDVFEVRANSGVIFHETFSNGLKPQSFRPPDVGPTHLGYSSSFKDSIYRDISVSFQLPEGSQKLSLTFEGIGLQGLVDESWGIDNITVSYQVVNGMIPAPGTLAPGAAAVALLARRRRTA